MINFLFKNYINLFFKNILYSETWEDFDIDKKALLFKSKDRLLCITSGGSYALNSCLENLSSITSLDSNEVQNYILELKIAAIKNLNYEDFWKFMTIKENRNIRLYKIMRLSLSTNARTYFDKNINIIYNGVLNNGALYFGLKLMKFYLTFFAGRKNISKLVKNSILSSQIELYKKEIEPRIWNIHSKNLSLWSMLLYGVSPDQIRLVKKEDINGIKDIYKFRMKEVFSKTLVKNNFYWYYILTGKYNKKIAPPYLRRENYLKLKENIRKINIVYSDLLRFLKSKGNLKFNKISLSDVLDWVDDKKRDEIIDKINNIRRNDIKVILRTKSRKYFYSEFSLFKMKEGIKYLSKIEKTASYTSVQVFQKL